MLMVTWCCSECCVPSGLDFEAAGGSIVRYCLSNSFASRASTRCKHGMGALSWLNAVTLKRAPNPPPSLWRTCKVLHPWALFCETTALKFVANNTNFSQVSQKPELYFHIVNNRFNNYM